MAKVKSVDLSRPSEFRDQQWQEKIERAKQARENGRRARQHSAPAFSTHRRWPIANQTR